MLEREIKKSKLETNDTINHKEDTIKVKFKWKDMIPSMIYGPLMIAQFILVVFSYNYYRSNLLVWLGWMFFALFMIIGALPRIEFKKHGGAPKGKNFMHTTKLVDTGIYSIIRHPYWSCWILLSISLTLMSQHLIMAVLCIPICILVYLETFNLDKGLIRKFGEEYIEYKKRVPRMNIILGIIQNLLKKK